MLPAKDNVDSHKLIIDIIKHFINSMIHASCPSLDNEQTKKLPMRMQQLAKTFEGLNMFHKKWTWPKRVGMEKVTMITKAPPGNIMPYIPSKSSANSPCVHIWNSFVKTMNAYFDNLPANDCGRRLSIFRSLADGSISPCAGGSARLPHILSNSSDKASSTKSDGTWEEIVLGQPENGRWETALRFHDKKRETSFNHTIARNLPLNTNPFVQP
jgi:hypothetical protein